MDRTPVIVVHGGAINPPTEEFNKGVMDAVLEGMHILEKGGSSIEAVVQTVKTMEDNPIFNAGTGSWPNLYGEVEMDAIVMDGKTLSAGAVACIKAVKNPVLVAKKVMDQTDHFLLVGEGAVNFARMMGFNFYDPLTPQRKRQWEETLSRLKKGERIPMFEYWKKLKEFMSDTVGAVAMDIDGNIAAATSSGGFPLKLPGRVGDVPLIGCSTYASNNGGGVSITGHGEIVMRHLLAKKIVDEMEGGKSAQTAVEHAIHFLDRVEREKTLIAIIAVDRQGNVGAARTTADTPHAYISIGMDKPKVNFAPIIR